MNEKLKIALGVILGVVGTIALFCLVVVICCSVNGLTFGEQVCEWFGVNSAVDVDLIEQETETIAESVVI